MENNLNNEELMRDLLRSKERLESIVNSLNIYIYSAVFEKEKVVERYHSPKCLEITGYTYKEFLINENLWYEMIYPADRALVSSFLDRLRKFGNHERIEHRVIKKSGEVIWVSNTGAVHFNECNELKRIDGFIQDISELKNSLERQDLLYEAVEQSPASVVITDVKGNIEYVNPKFVRISGYESGEVIGQNPRILKSGDKPPESYRDMWEKITSGNEWRGEFKNLNKNKEVYYELASISPVKNDKGEITHFVSVKEDITEIKHAEWALKKSEKNLRRKNDLIKNELKRAQSIQKLILQTSIPANDKIDIKIHFKPLEDIGGDFYTFFQFDNKVGLFLGDVVGHGISAALFLSLLKFATHSIYQDYGQETNTYLKKLNEILYAFIQDYFITAIYGVFSFYSDGSVHFSFSNAGHPDMVYYNNETREYSRMNAKGTFLGAFANVEYEKKTLKLSKGDRLFLYTDGIPETKNKEYRIYGYENILDLFEKTKGLDLNSSLEKVLDLIDNFRGEANIDDDLLIIGVEVK